VGNSKYLTKGLVYEREHDRFRCPQGKYLNANLAICDHHKRYASSSADCRVCPLLLTCPTEAKKNFPYHRYVRRNVDQDLFEEVQVRMRDPTFEQKMSERMWKMEGLFAEAKQYHALSRAKYRGRPKVQIQAYLSAIVQNLKRLLCPLYCWLAACWSRLTRATGRHDLPTASSPTSIR
jgi:Transposase DDE domain